VIRKQPLCHGSAACCHRIIPCRASVCQRSSRWCEPVTKALVLERALAFLEWVTPRIGWRINDIFSLAFSACFHPRVLLVHWNQAAIKDGTTDHSSPFGRECCKEKSQSHHPGASDAAVQDTAIGHRNLRSRPSDLAGSLVQSTSLLGDFRGLKCS
jgi:hypothetical protein